MPSFALSSPLPWSHRLSDQVLGRDAKQRLRIRRSLMAASVYLGLGLLRLLGVAFGLVSAEVVALLSLYEFMGVGLFYALLRSGYSLRLRDPSMTLAQILFGLSSVSVSYALIEVSRGAALQLLCLILVFGMYRLTPAQILLCAALACAMLGSTLVVMWQTHVEPFNPRQEALNFALAAFILPMLAFIGYQVGGMRQRQLKLGRELVDTLERLQDLATRDTLTGLYNRRHMLDLLTDELKRFGRTGHVFSLALLDIDHFKRINDNWGHPAGDAVLAGLAGEMREVLRQSDVLARWGGEEFLLLMPDSSAAAARVPLERLLQRLAARTWAPDLPADERVTASIGLAEFQIGEPLEQTLARADAALYRAKSGGRHQLCVAAPTPETVAGEAP